MYVGARGVSSQWCRWPDKEKTWWKKKLELIEERGSLEADRRTDEEEKKMP